jgi:hypothetical protein
MNDGWGQAVIRRLERRGNRRFSMNQDSGWTATCTGRGFAPDYDGDGFIRPGSKVDYDKEVRNIDIIMIRRLDYGV